MTDPFNEQLTKILKTNVCLVKTIVTMPFNEQLTVYMLTLILKINVCIKPVWYICLKTENCYLKIFIEIRE